jgi:hypothetical protein
MGIPYPIPIGGGLRDAMRSLTSADLLHAHGALYATSIHAAARRFGDACRSCSRARRVVEYDNRW